MVEKVERSEQEWRERLSAEQYRVLREKGTEPPFTGRYTHNPESGTYHCAACGAPLFRSAEKFDSGSGWPSFWAPVADDAIAMEVDHSHGMRRIEARCARCGSHLGHLFEDGPPPTGQRYCINSVSLDFERDA
jgi:peptide-methionine (R)-S-oxide reductase